MRPVGINGGSDPLDAMDCAIVSRDGMDDADDAADDAGGGGGCGGDGATKVGDVIQRLLAASTQDVVGEAEACCRAAEGDGDGESAFGRLLWGGEGTRGEREGAGEEERKL